MQSNFKDKKNVHKKKITVPQEAPEQTDMLNE